jgi:hypothetical protein
MLGLGMLSACATHEQQSRQPAAPAATSVPQVWSFETEWTRAASGSASGSAGQAWERSVNPTVEHAYGAVLDDCATQRNSGDPGANSDQRLVLDIAQGGNVRQVWSETDSPLLTCARASLSRTRFAPPPLDGYRLGLVLDLGNPDMPSQFPRLPRPMPGPISSYEAMRLAITDMGTQEGRPYMESFSSTFLAFFRSNLEKCMTIPLLETERSLRGYGLIIEIASDGTTQRMLVEPDPETSASEQFQSPRVDCLRDGLSRAKLAMPPWDGFWLYMGLNNPPTGVPTE